MIMRPIPFPKSDVKGLASWVIYVLVAVVVFLFGIYTRSQEDLLQFKILELEQKQKEADEYKGQIALLSAKLEKCRDERADLLSQFYVRPGLKTLTITPSVEDGKNHSKNEN